MKNWKKKENSGLTIDKNGIASNTVSGQGKRFSQTGHLLPRGRRKLIVVGVFGVFEYDECALGREKSCSIPTIFSELASNLVSGL